MTVDDDYYYSNLLGQTFGSEGNCDSFHSHSQGEEKQATADTQATLPISEALRLHSGSVKVQGMIVGRSQLCKMIVSTTLNCTNCNHQFRLKHEPPLLTRPKREKTRCPSQFTISKYGINATIKAPTTIIASANPINSTWKNGEGDDRINLNEIPAIKPLLDRFDFIYVFRKPKDENSIREYAYKKSQLEGRKIPDYHNYLQKHILYSKRINPILSEEAKEMLNEYWIRIAKDFGSPRILETLFRLAKAIARLKLKEIVDAKDARETMQYYNVNLQQYQQVVSIPDNPRDIAYNICVNILSETKSHISLDELIAAASKRSEQIKHYLGDERKLRKNWKIRSILEMLLNHESIKRIQEKPMILLWVTNNDNSSTSHTTTHTSHSQKEGDKRCEVCDACDEQNKEDDNNYKRFKCFHCEEHFSNDAERVNHIGYKHQGKMIYPEPENFEGRFEK